MRLFDLNLLGADSRVTFGYTYQCDAVRGAQHIGLLTLRIPFGRGAGRNGRRMTRYERRMVEPIVRDVDVVTQSPTVPAYMNSERLGQDSVTQVNGGDLGTAVTNAGANSVVVATGTFNPAGTITLNQNQAVVGAGGSLQVTTASGVTATYTAPGTRPTINGTANADGNPDRVFQLVENSTLSGVTIEGGEVGVYCQGTTAPADPLTGITVVDNRINNMEMDFGGGPPNADTGHGIHLHDQVSGDITDNTLEGNEGNGLNLTGGTITGGSIAGNTIDGKGNGVRGIYLKHFKDGTISGNVVRGYTLDLSPYTVANDAYVHIDEMEGGTISDNIIEGNNVTNDDTLYAVRIGTMSGGTITRNTVRDNTVTVTSGDVAALYVGTMTGGTVSHNTVDLNSVTCPNGNIAAMFVNSMQGGFVEYNNVNNNKKVEGIDVAAFAANNMSGGFVRNNTVDGNTTNASGKAAGFAVLNTFSGGEISNNTVSNNKHALGKTAPDGFAIGIFEDSVGGADPVAALKGNTSTSNTGKGYAIGVDNGGDTGTGNAGSGNGSNPQTYP